MLTRWWLITVHGCRQWFYPGSGTGWQDRSTQRWKEIEVIVTFWRESNQGSVRVTEQSNGAGRKVTESGNGVTEQSNGAQSAKKKLTGKVQDIVNYCTVPRTAAEILSRMGLTNQTKNRKKYINPLVEEGLLKLTIPDKLNDPNQKYVNSTTLKLGL